MICPHCKKENANEYAVVCAYCKNNMYPDANPEEKAKELSKAQQKNSVFSGVKGVLSVILAIIVVVGVILMPKPSFGNKGTTSVQGQPETTQKQQSQNVVTTTNAPIIETTTQKQKMSYAQARNWLVEYAKKGTYDAEEKTYTRVIEKYDMEEDEVAFLSLKYYPESNSLSLVRSYNSVSLLFKYSVSIDKYETTEMSTYYNMESSSYIMMVSGRTTKDTYRPGVNIPCVDYWYGRRGEKPKDHTLEDETKASNNMSTNVASMLMEFDEFLKNSNAEFDLTTLGYKSFYGI